MDDIGVQGKEDDRRRIKSYIGKQDDIKNGEYENASKSLKVCSALFFYGAVTVKERMDEYDDRAKDQTKGQDGRPEVGAVAVQGDLVVKGERQ